MAGSYIVAGARTPIGKMSGAFASLSAADLGGFAIREALARAGVAPDEVEHVLMGQVLMAGQGQVPSRQAAVKAGIPMSVPSVNINKEFNHLLTKELPVLCGFNSSNIHPDHPYPIFFPQP